VELINSFAEVHQRISYQINFSMQNIYEENVWTRPDEFDALTAAPQHHKLLFENEFVRLLDANIPPGEITNVHTHHYPASLYIISWSDFIRYDADGNVMLDSRSLEKTLSRGLQSGAGHYLFIH